MTIIDTYKLNDKVLYRKNKNYRYNIYSINKYLINNYIELKDSNDNIININLYKKNIDIKKYFYYKEPKVIYSFINNKSDLIFSFKCSFCNIIHKHNKLGHQDCKCNSNYSPYYKYGYILKLKEFDLDIVNFNYYENYNIIYNYYKNKYILFIKSMDFSNFNDYLLHNYKLLLVKNLLSKSSIIWYVRYIKQFYMGEICSTYKDKFPFINNEDISMIKKCKEKKISNLLTTLKKFIILISTEPLLYKLDKFEDKTNELIKFYKSTDKKKTKDSKKTTTKKKQLFTNKMISNIDDNIIKKNQKDSNLYNNKKDNIDINNNDTNNNSIENAVENINLYNDYNENKINKKDINVKYILDIEDCIKEYIDNDIEKQILSKIKITDKHCFYIKLENRIHSQMWGYMDLWITVEDYGDNLWGVSDTNEFNPEFIKYKESIK